MDFQLSIINGKTVSDVICAHRAECIDVVEHAYLAHARGQAINPHSYFLRFPEKPDCRIIALPAFVGDGFAVAGLKWIASYPGNVQKGFPRASAVLILNSYETGCRPEHHRSVTVVPHVTDLLTASDLIVFTTVASTPHIADPWLFDHNPLVLHISLRDLAPEILLRSQNVVDDVEHVMKANTSPHLAEQKTGNRNFVTGTLADIMTGRRSVNRSRPIIFSPFGMGILDLAVGKWVYDQAVAASRDQRLSDFFYETV